MLKMVKGFADWVRCSVALILCLVLSLVVGTSDASAHCGPWQLSGLWSMQATGPNVSSSGFVRFTPDQKAAIVGQGSAFGLEPTVISIPLSAYNLDWDSAPDVFPEGVCKVSATYTHGGQTERYWFTYRGGASPNELWGGDSVMPDGLTLNVHLSRLVYRLPR